MSVRQIGATTVTRVEEMRGPSFRATTLFPDWDDAVLERHRDWLVPNYFNAEKMTVVMSLHSWVIRAHGLTILVDTCIGNDKDRMPAERWHMQDNPYLERLQAAGVAPEEVDVVMCTHLHVDHVGWNTRLVDGRWVPTFPNARYLFSRTEYEHFQANSQHMDREAFDDSIVPVVNSGQAEMTEGEHPVAEGIWLEPAPGHTPGHVAMKLESDGAAAIFTGDILHHPLQVYRPEWNSRFCVLPDAARASRRGVLDYCADKGALLMPAHFGDPHCGHVHRDGAAYTLDWHHNAPAA